MFLKNTALLVFGVLLAVGLLESALRVTGWAFLKAREPARLSPAAASTGTIRILCLGESTTADLALLGRESYPFQLQRILNERSGGDRFVVINGGVPATTTDLIVERLPAALDRHRPDIVVTMMGVNDGPLADPLLEVSPRSSSAHSWRVLKLGRLLLASVFGVATNLDPADSDAGEALQVEKIARKDGLPALDVPQLTLFALTVTAKMLMEGRFDEAEEALVPLAEGSLEGDLRMVTSVAVGQLVLLHYQRGDEAAGARYHERYRELMDLRQNPKTTVNYTILRELVAERGLPLVAVQYPGRALAPLRRVLGDVPNIAFVDNEETFMRAVKSGPLSELYRDLFAGIFGHLTPHGNSLLAANVADTILEVVEQSTMRPIH